MKPTIVERPAIESVRTQRWCVAAAVGSFVIVMAIFAAPLFAGKVYYCRDLFGSYYPTLHFLHRCLQSGDSFLWMPQMFGGCYLHGIGQAAMTHPLQLALYSLLPWPWPFVLIYPLSYPFMFMGMYVLLKREGVGKSPALFGSLVTTLSGFAMLHWMHIPAIGVMAHTPWLLVMIRAVMDRTSPTRVALAIAGISLFTASQCLLGYPQFVYFSCLIEGLYILFAIPWNRWPRVVSLIGAAKILGVVMASVQLIPTWDFLAHSERAIPDLAFRTSYSLPPYMLLQLLGPNLFNRGALGENAHEYGIYCGVTTVLLAIWAIARFRHLGPKRTWVFVLAGLGIVLALGKYGGLYSLLSYLPLLDKFRCPTRHVAVVHFAFGVLAALAFADLARARKHESYRRALIPVAAAVIVAWLIPVMVIILSTTTGFWTAWLSKISFSPPSRMFIGPVLATIAGILILAATRGRRYALPLLILFAAADQAWFGLRYVHFGPALEPMKLVEGFAKPPGPERSTADWATDPATMMLTMADYSTIDGYSALIPERQLDYTTQAARRIAGVRWLNKSKPDIFLHPEPDYPNRPLWEDLGLPLPRVRFTTTAEVAADVKARINHIDPEMTALVSEAVTLDEGEPGTTDIVEDRPGNITIRTTAPGRQLLVLAESYHEGWQARIDDVPARVLAVYGDFMGCVVPPGDHLVQFVFLPKSMAWGLRGTIIGAVGTLLLAMLIRFAPRRQLTVSQTVDTLETDVGSEKI